MNYNELAKQIREVGWTLHRHGAKHDIYSHPDSEEFIQLPRHGKKEVPTGLASNIKKKAGLK